MQHPLTGTEAQPVELTRKEFIFSMAHAMQYTCHKRAKLGGMNMGRRLDLQDIGTLIIIYDILSFL
jgi:hypothetical protein